MARKSMPAPTGVSMRVSALASALALALAGVDAHALGLGGIRVQSALNQPFVGEIDLLDVRPDELDTVKVQIARSEEFSRVGAERYHYLTKLRFSPQISPRGNTVIRVSSREPVREPYMDFLVDVQWPKGRLVKEYTLLLDPPVTSARRAPPVKQPVKQPVARARSAPDPVPAPTASEPAATTTPNPVPAVSARAPASAPAAAPASAGGFPLRVGPVRTGSGLWRLALKNSPRGATVAQTAMALYRNNQGAFIQGDINRLLAGRTLVIPSSAELFALAPDAAQRELEAALRGDKVRQAPIADTRPDQPAAESAESRLKIAGAAAEDAKPSASAPPLAGQPPGNMEQELLLVRESSESTRQETLELRGRIRELEAQLGEIQQLLKLRNAELARIQGGSQAASALPDQVPVGPVAAAGEERMPDEAEPLPPGLENALAAVGAPSGPGSLPVYPEAAGGSQYLAIPPEGASGAESATDEVLPDQGQPVTGGETPADTAQADLGEQTTASGSGPDAARTPATDPPGQLEPEPSVAPAEQPPAGGSFWNQTWLPLAGMAGVLA
ncbi:MAG: FimV/HubP family polar landmark protein, partial [Chromatiaceae bacterium]